MRELRFLAFRVCASGGAGHSTLRAAHFRLRGATTGRRQHHCRRQGGSFEACAEIRDARRLIRFHCHPRFG